MNKIRRAVCILLHNENGDILTVSRKNNHFDFGIPGGAVEPGETDEEAIIREVKEETGLDIFNIRPFFVNEEEIAVDDITITTTFIGNYIGEISTTEKGIVKWSNFDLIKKGSFGEYNSKLENAFKIKHKYKSGDVIINIETDEVFAILFPIDSNDSPSGYFVKSFCSSIKHSFIKKTAIDNVKMYLISSLNKDESFNSDNFFEKVKRNTDNFEKYFAISSHFDTNQYYDDNFLYSFHLRQVVDIGKKFKQLIPIEDWDYVEGGLWNHDVCEDARVTYKNLKDAIGEKPADISFALTNETGKTREERTAYEKIRNTKYATFAKLCDMIANVEYSFKTGSSMYKKYKNEQYHFIKELYVPGEYEEMWDYLGKI